MTRLLAKAAALLPFLFAAASAAPASSAATRAPLATPDRRDAASATTLAPTAPHAPREFGPYRVLRKLGSGGMGTVYLAESQSPVRRRVALKTVGEGLFAPSLMRQFAVEQQALALAEHPGIARLYECGADENGRPWLAMEWVDGEPLLAYCERRELALDERLELFVQLARSVEHLHTRGVLHGDLKPDNVLVTERDGAPRAVLIDLGLARLRGAAFEPANPDDTELVMGTPAFMAPEHFAFGGPQLDERADVFSLGVVLRQLLGRHGAAAGEAGAHWLHAPAPKAAQRESASARLDPRDSRWLRRLRNGLEAAVVRATALAREQRTSSAAELARQVEGAISQEKQRAERLANLVRIGLGSALGAGLAAVAGAALVNLA